MTKKIVVLGAANVDFLARVNALKSNSSIPGDIVMTCGGVARNVSRVLGTLKIPVSLITVFSDDIFSKMMINDLLENNVEINHSYFHVKTTSKCLFVFTNSQEYSINDTKILELIDPSFIQSRLEYINQSDLFIFDMSIKEEVLETITKFVETKLVCEATSVVKSSKIRKYLSNLYILKANYLEACNIAECPPETNITNIIEIIEKLLLKGTKKIYITLGKEGAVYASNDYIIKINIMNSEEFFNTVGAGDAFAAGIIYGEMQKWKPDKILKYATQIAIQYLKNGFDGINDYVNLEDRKLILSYWNQNNRIWSSLENDTATD